MPSIRVFERGQLRRRKFVAFGTPTIDLDGVTCDVLLGAWALYTPDLKIKLLHAQNGMQTCTHKVARRFVRPTKAERHYNSDAHESRIKIGSYFVKDWENALTKSVSRRVAETWIASRRLAEAGLGPIVSDIVIVRTFFAPYTDAVTMTAGYIQENALALPPGPNPDEESMIAAGVKPDQIKSCIRQPKNGYIIDLNSVVGVEPIDAEDEIAALTKHINQAL